MKPAAKPNSVPKRNGIPKTDVYKNTSSPFFGLKYYRSQVGQDRYMNDKFAKGAVNGVFVEVGAFDGYHLSNTYFFEKQLDWTGICVEAHPTHFAKLKQNRDCVCVHGAAFSKPGKLRLRISTENKMLSGVTSHHNTHARMKGTISQVEVPGVVLKKLFRDHDIKIVDYMSVDTEGSELEVLKGVDFSAVHINIINLEHNFDKKHLDAIHAFLTSRGFVVDRYLVHDVFYRNKNLRWSWKTS